MSTPTRWRGRGRPLAIIGALLLLGTVGTFPARGQVGEEGPALGGFNLRSEASVFEYTYASPGLLPTGDVIFQASLPYSLAQLNSGPTGRALSSLAWPGPLLADLGVLIEQGVEEDQRPPFRVPSYPVRAQAFTPQGPHAEETELAPGARMRAVAEGTLAHADTRFTGMMIPGVFEAAGIASDATTEVVDDVATTTSRTVLTDVSVLAGLLRIGELVTEVVTTSDGEVGDARAVTSVADVTFAGVAATIDAEGIHLAEQEPGGNDITDQVTSNVPFGDVVDGLRQGTDPLSEGLGQLLGQVDGGLNQLAEQSGITIRLLPGSTTVDESAAEALSAGLQIELFYDGQTTPVFSDLLALVPIEQLPSDPLLPIPFNTSPQALVSLLKETHIQTITLGSGFGSAVAAPGFDFDFDIDFGGDGGFDGAPTVLDSSGGSGFSAAPGGVPGGSTSTPAPGGPVALGGGLLPAVSGDAIPGTIALVLVFALPFFATGARRLHDFTLPPR